MINACNWHTSTLAGGPKPEPDCSMGADERLTGHPVFDSSSDTGKKRLR